MLQIGEDFCAIGSNGAAKASAKIRDVTKFSRGLHHLIVVQRVEAVPGLEIPVLYLAEPDGVGGEQLKSVDALTNFFVDHSASSMTWMRQRARGLGMLYDYLVQRRGELEGIAASSPVSLHRIVFTQFENHIAKGTVSDAPDGTGLFWRPLGFDNCRNIMRGMRGFANWLHDDGFGDRLRKIPLRERELPRLTDETLHFVYAARHEKDVEFGGTLKHVKRSRQLPTPNILGRDPRDFGVRNHVQFPREWLAALFGEGFLTDARSKDPDRREDITAKLGVMLEAFGGIRPSEKHHVWVNDVQWVDGMPTVFMHHPSNATVTHEIHGVMSREQYLRNFCLMEPRHRAPGKLRAGWKGMKLNRDFWAPIYWLPFDGLTEYFWNTYLSYVTEIRPQLMLERRRRGLPEHPFLLVSSGGANQQDDRTSVGDPYTCTAARNSWCRAMGRLQARYNDRNLEVAKKLGTTQHGLRHLYGAILAELRLGDKNIQECMRHVSPLSQLTYTKPRDEHINAMLVEASARIRRGDFPALRSQFLGLTEALMGERDVLWVCSR